MERVSVLVIGAGAVGLAIGYELSKSMEDIVIVDKESSFGKHTSSRNSEVIHAGLYYPAGTLKAQLCVRGNPLLYDFLAEHKIKHKNTGKVIVSTCDDEISVINKYMKQGTANGCQGLQLMSADEIHALEPLVNCNGGLWVPTTGIFDTHEYMHTLSTLTEANGGFIVYGMEAVSISKVDDRYQVTFSNNEVIECKYLINSAGLWADKIAGLIGIDVTESHLKLYPCKGEYYKTTKIKDVKHLIYPVADPKGVFLGIHLTINLNGEVRFGPNAFYVDDINYKFEEGYFNEFYTSINRYITIDKSDLIPDDTGIRPKLQGPEDAVKDFYISEESSRGYPGLVNLIGIESPGLTASLAIAEYVKNMIE